MLASANWHGGARLLRAGHPTGDLALGRWAGPLDWKQRKEGHFLLLLSRVPDAVERRILIAAGIPVDGTIAQWPEAGNTPMELVFRGGRALYRAAGSARPSSVLLEKLDAISLGAFAASLEAQTASISQHPH